MFELVIVIPTLVVLAYLAASTPSNLPPVLLLWVAILAFVELLPVPFWRDVHLSMGFPLLIAVGFLYSPVAAGLVALTGSFDLRELRREVTFLRAVFNRCQVALAVMAASAMFHLIGSATSPLPLLFIAALVAAITDYIVNFGLVAVGGSILYRLRVPVMFERLRVGGLLEFVVGYLGLGAIGVVLCELYLRVQFWAVPTFLVPLIFARQMFFRGRALEEAHKSLQAREQVLEQLSNRMAEERQDERAQIAAYLHDDLAQLLFRLSLQVDIAKRHLRHGSADEVEADLEAIRESKNRTNELVRALIRDLHRSPLGRAGLAEALKSFAADVGGGSGVSFHTDVDDLPLPPPIALLIYHISREAVMNSLKHAGGDNVWINLGQQDDVVVLSIRDDGLGFDSDGPGPEGHYGLNMMRERAQVAGGSFKIESVEGQGTTITASFPTSWLDEDNESPSDDEQPTGSLTEPPPTRDVKTELVRPPRDASEPTEQVVLA
jgi:signal transduction histidine kinase